MSSNVSFAPILSFLSIDFLNIFITYCISSFFTFYLFFFFMVQSLPTFSDLSFNYLNILTTYILRYYLVTSSFGSLVHLYLLCIFSLNFQLCFLFLYIWFFKVIKILTLRNILKLWITSIFHQENLLLSIADHLNSNRD